MKDKKKRPEDPVGAAALAAPRDEPREEKDAAPSAAGSAQADDTKEQAARPYGKFRDPDALYGAYLELEKEFTRKSQRLAEAERALSELRAEQPAPEEGEEKLKRETEEFFSALPAACAHAADIANCLKEHPELMSEPDCLYKAFARYAAGALRTPEQLMADGQFLKDHVLTSTAVKAAVIGEYLGELRKGAPPAVLGSGGLSCVLPPRTPASIEEAGKLFLKQNS